MYGDLRISGQNHYQEAASMEELNGESLFRRLFPDLKWYVRSQTDMGSGISTGRHLDQKAG